MEAQAFDIERREAEDEEDEEDGEEEANAAMQGMKVEDDAEDAQGEREEDEDEDEEPYKCDLCSKVFKSNAQLAQHITSKAHRKAEKDAAKGSKGKKPGFVKRGKSNVPDEY